MYLEELIEGKIQLDSALAITELRIKATEEKKKCFGDESHLRSYN